jgi:hypothetical protein
MVTTMNTARLKEIIGPITEKMKDAEGAFGRQESLLGDALERAAFNEWLNAYDEVVQIIMSPQ